MKVTHCGEFMGRRYRVNAELDRRGRIVSFVARYFPVRGGFNSLAIVPDKPISTGTSLLNPCGKKFIEQFKEFLEQSYDIEIKTIH